MGPKSWISKSSVVVLIAALCLLAAAAAAAAQEDNVEGNFDELPPEQFREVTKLQGAFLEIQKTIGQGRTNFNPEISMETAKAMQKKDWAFGLLNGKLSEALRLFTSLPQTLEKEYCNYKGYEILAKNFLLNPTSGHLTFSTSILYHYARQHAIECLPRYAKKYLWESNSVGIVQLSRQLNKYFKGLELEDFTPDTLSPVRENDLAHIPFVEGNLNSFDVRASGLIKILNNMDSKLWQPAGSRSTYVQATIEGNLLKPCGTYVERMRDIFAPAKIDLFMYRVGNQVPQPELSEKFINGWTSYRICLYLDRADRKDIVSRFVKAYEISAQ